MAHKHSIYDTDKHFLIDPVTRGITTECRKTVLMQGDHNSERYTFEIPRYIDGHDMSLCNRVEIHYQNATYKDMYTAKDTQVSPDSDDIIIFSWLISGNATQYVDLLTFAVHFYCDAEDGTIDYIWKTASYENVKIQQTNNSTESISDEYATSDFISQINATLSSVSSNMYVTVTENDDGSLSADKTFGELSDYIEKGDEVIAVFGSFYLNLMSKDSNKIVFGSSEFDVVSAYRTLTFDNSTGEAEITYKHEIPGFQLLRDTSTGKLYRLGVTDEKLIMSEVI